MADGQAPVGMRSDAARSVVAGIAMMVFAGMMSSMMHIGVRYVSPHLPAIETVFLRSVFTLLTTMPIILLSGGASWRTNHLGLQITRGCVGVCSMATWYYALGNMPLADAGVLSFTTVIFVTVGAALWFRERVGIWRWLAVLVGLLGAVFVLRPGSGIISWAAIAAVGSSVLWAASLLIAKELGKYDTVLTITFYQPLMITPLAAIGTIPVWVNPPAEVWGVLMLMGVIAAVGNYGYIKALRLADASIVMPADYVRLVWMVWWGFLLFGEWPDVATWIGAALIVASTMFITIRERHLARVRAAAAPPTTGPVSK
jgi:drug/metabolite transporter (DMT)-like permease